MKIVITASIIAIIGAIISFISMCTTWSQANISKKSFDLQEKIYDESRPNFKIADMLDSYAMYLNNEGITKMMFYPLIINLSDKPMIIKKVRLKIVGENTEIILTPIIKENYIYDGCNVPANNSISKWVSFEINNTVQNDLKIIKYILMIEDSYKNNAFYTVIWLKEMVNIDEEPN